MVTPSPPCPSRDSSAPHPYQPVALLGMNAGHEPHPHWAQGGLGNLGHPVHPLGARAGGWENASHQLMG